MNGIKHLIILGSAPSVLEDLSAVMSMLHSISRPCAFMLVGCKSKAETMPAHIDYHVSHENDFPQTRQIRKALGLNTDYRTFSNNPWPGVDCILPRLTPPTCSMKCKPRLGSLDPDNHHYYSGSSAMLALKVGLMEGYGKIILAGVSLNEGRYTYFQKGWLWILPFLERLPVRAMSGFTRDIFGAPTEDWLNA